jgi:hypothetical protein
VRADAEFAARVEIEDGPLGVLDLAGGVEVDLAFGIQVHVQDAGRFEPLHIDPGRPLLEAGVDDALLHEHLPVQQEHDHPVHRPGGDLVGLDDDGLGVAGHVAAQPQQVALPGEPRRPGPAGRHARRAEAAGRAAGRRRHDAPRRGGLAAARGGAARQGGQDQQRARPPVE